MVTVRAFISTLVTLLFLSGIAVADDTRVSMQLSDKDIYPNEELQGTITVQHNRSDEVDPSAFHVKGEPLHVEFIRNVEISPQSDLVISFYSFQLPPQESGLHVLPGITVSVAGKSYSTPATTYEVKQRSTMVRGPGGIILQLETFVEGKLPMYVGQEISVGYRIFFNGNIELTEQVLPLIDAVGFKKIGSERIGDVREGGISVRQIEQLIEATKAETFTFGPSYLTGYTYTTDWRGKKKAMGGTIKAETAPVKIVVLDFPKEGQPSSFNGSVGEDIDFDVSLISPPLATVGDKFILSVTFSSDKDMPNIKLPEICCQPGFPGFFELDDIPPLPVERENSKMFSVDLRPLTPHIREIPSIEFSYFNPDKELYEVRRSKAISVRVNPSPSKSLPMSPGVPTAPDQKAAVDQKDVVWPTTTAETQPIEIHTIYPLGMDDLTDRLFGTWAVFLILPFGGFFIYVQVDIREKRKKKVLAKGQKDSTYWFDQAKASQEDVADFYHLLNKAFILRLFENRWILEEVSSPQELPDEGMCKKVKHFLCGIDEMRFSQKRQQSNEDIIAVAEQLFYEIGRGTEGKKHD
jgi:hypothetical protein